MRSCVVERCLLSSPAVVDEHGQNDDENDPSQHAGDDHHCQQRRCGDSPTHGSGFCTTTQDLLLHRVSSERLRSLTVTAVEASVAKRTPEGKQVTF